MSQYATVAETQTAMGSAKLIEIADFDGNGSLDTASVNAALTEASALADTYLGSYLPITVIPAVLKRHVINIGIYLLRVSRDFTTEDSRRAYEDALAWLKDIAKGLASIPELDSGGSPTGESSTAGRPLYSGDSREWYSSAAKRLF